MENRFYAKVTQYTDERNGRPLKINRTEFAGGGEIWEIIDACFCIGRYKTALEVKAFLGHRPKLCGAYELYITPVDRTIEKQLYGRRVY